MYLGEFELHLTGSQWQVEELAAFAQRHGVKFSHIELQQGAMTSQPMLTIGAKGTIDEVRAAAASWRARLREAGLHVVRVKVEAAPWNDGVPQSEEDADPAQYFEHHVKVLLRGDQDHLVSLIRAARPYQAHVSRNARRTRSDGQEERFVTQRCFGVGRGTARARLEELLGHLGEFEVLEVEEEYVVDDDAGHLDHGWIDSRYDFHTNEDERFRRSPAGLAGFPSTYQPLDVRPGQDIRQRAVFDPALKHFPHAFRGGDPLFGDPADGARWLDARRAAMAHVLRVIGDSDWTENLVLRGSTAMRAWFGDAAREPGDLDFVVTPRHLAFDSPRAKALIADLVAGVAADPGPGLRADQARTEHIWTYERVPGRRIVFPFDVEGLPRGAIQIDLVFNEELPIAPEPVEVTGTILLGANQELSLAWKLQWLMTDMYPQAKDLYDAALLAGHTTVDLELVRRLLRPELGTEADTFGPDSVLRIDDVDWANAPTELPAGRDDQPGLLRRIAAALR